MIYTVTLNPALDKTVEIPNFTAGSINRIAALRTDPGGKGINVSKVIANFGGESVILGILGGQYRRCHCQKAGRNGTSLRSGICTRGDPDQPEGGRPRNAHLHGYQ